MDSSISRTLFLAGVGSLAAYLVTQSKRSLPLPPGPPADPLIGHLRIFPSSNQEDVFHEWAQKYGDVMCLRILGQTIIILDTHEAAVELLEKRSALYSDRPEVVVYNLMGWDRDLALIPYGSRFRKHRKILAPAFLPNACIPYQQTQLENAHLLVEGLSKSKGHNYLHLLGRYTSAVIMRITYGHQIRSDDDIYIQLATNAGHSLHAGGVPGATPVDLLPFLQHMPSWFPGTHYANAARLWLPAVQKFHDHPFDAVVKQMAEGTAEESFLSLQLEATAGRTLSKDEINDIKGAAAQVYVGGAETTWSGLTSFFMAMLLFPQCQKLAQEEVDRVIGKDRLPSFDDRESLPYVDAVVQETLRWGRIIPLGVPHRSTEDDIYRGMFIPKGSYIFANIAGMSRDESKYKDPRQFNPSRFLPKSMGGSEEPPFWDVFGFGRRVCPGRHLATANIWIAVATIFATLHLSKAIDETGQEIVPVFAFNAGITSLPKPFPCGIAPRSEKAEKLISEAIHNAH